MKETQWRLMSELPPLLKQILEQLRTSDLESAEHRVISFRCPI